MRSSHLRTAIVTGVSRPAGIGLATTRRLLADGARVFAQGWRLHDAEQPWSAADTDLDADATSAWHADLNLEPPDAPSRLVGRPTLPSAPSTPWSSATPAARRGRWPT